jgi:hypothetical protein
MLSRTVTVACVLMLGLSACSKSVPPGQPAAATTEPGSTTQALGNAPSVDATTKPPGQGTGTGTKPATHTSAPTGPTTPAAADFGFGWSNAECQWSLSGSTSAEVRMTGTVTSTAPNTAMIILTVSSNGGGVPQITQYYPAAHLAKGDTRYVADITAPLANLANHTIRFTGTLTFNGQRDDLAADNANSLAVTFPATFQAATTGGNVEFLGCAHVSN